MSEMSEKPLTIEPPYYPIVYIRGYAMTEGERDGVFHDAYYGFSATSVEKRDALPPKDFEVDIFEGQFIRLMKLKKYGYADSVNRGLHSFHSNPTRSIWISRFYDRDYVSGKIRSIVDHASELCDLIAGPEKGSDQPDTSVLKRLKDLKDPEDPKKPRCYFGPNDEQFKVILIAHSMGGLVCRTLIQNVMKKRKLDPKAWIHRLVTIASPHGGIELSAVPSGLQQIAAKTFNPFDSAIFNPPTMREYLNLDKDEDPRSLGRSRFPIKRCFCLIGSDHQDYSAVRFVTGGFSDGLVKQDRAYAISGDPKPVKGPFPEAQVSFGANVHRSHSGNRGIVNSFESFENIQRFLFGDIKAAISLGNFKVVSPVNDDARFFYHIEFLASIKGTVVYLQRREQDPCENAMRFDAGSIPAEISLYTGFLRSAEKTDPEKDFSEFALTIRVVEHRVEHQLLWDHEYPGRKIYDETLMIRVADSDPTKPGNEVSFMWLSDRLPDRAAEWPEVEPVNGTYSIDLRAAQSVSGVIRIVSSPWPDKTLTDDDAPSAK
jgi:hypothetical protein